MLRKEHNDLLTQTGPGTPMGQMFRLSWQPALLAEELPEPGCPPVRVKLLSERLLAWRDSNNKLALTDEFCAHRGVSLWFGRNEHGGLRCPYHGWKYDHNGQCIEVPSEPSESGYCQKIKLKSYLLIERGGVLWTYMGPPEKQPPLPEWEFAMVPASHSFMSKRLQECNWLQAMEGGIDSSHVSFLHSGELNTDPLFKGSKGNAYNMADMKPMFEVVESPGGLYIGARRNAENGNYYWRVTQWVMPAFTMIPPRADHPVHGHFWVPIDDENCWAWSFDYKVTRPLSDKERKAMEAGQGIHVSYVPGTYIPAANKTNDYLVDRHAQKEGRTFSGVFGIAMQDASLQESMGPVVDRTKENLVSTDNGIIMARHRLIRALKTMEKGEQPPGIVAEHQHVRSAAVVLPPNKHFKDAAKEALVVQTGKEHVTVSSMQSESARMSSAAEARYRIDAPNSKPRAVKVIALDHPSERVVKELSQRPWQRASFFTASAFGGAPKQGESFSGWLSDLAGRTKNLIEEVDSADLVVMVAAAGESAEAASVIGEACSVKRVMTTALVLGGPAISDEALSKTLSHLRPWALMLVIASAEEYIADMLTALRA